MKNIKGKYKRFFATFAVLLIIILITIIISLSVGSYKIQPIDILRTFIGQGSKKHNLIIWNIRLPRIIMAILVGTALSISGVILQGITRNDLSDPGIIGISSGSALAVVMYIYYMNGNVYDGISNFTIFTMPLVAFVGAFVGALLIYIFAWKKGMDANRLILTGIGINAIFTALLIIFQLRFTTQEFNRVIIWTLGSLWGTDWRYVLAVFPGIIVISFIAYYKSRYIDVISLGDEISVGLGIELEKEKRKLLIISVLLASMATSISGTLAFIGLISPHIARKLIGAKHKYLIPISALIGIIILLVSDIFSRNLILIGEMPVGIIVSFIGVPYFIYLMLKQ
ncbi:FecCD family ABC transporter permease [Caloramator australicus]|uniref:ABC-type Fe3+-siderophore transport system,permease 2 component n=1 Tax=Caloramator australicus RC3 TaxID=857293 RepID=G0V3R5_9CLOT|nr:iron ABC transporter permease [Caloramator australicus]CCC57755.1 ABC-type Fe3+-siderophore transport system,permease 2 component [Caloramator australicus RC3]